MSLNHSRFFFLSFVLVYLGVVVFNYGFIGVDEYWVAMVKYLPAQTTLLQDMVAADDVKSPSQFILFFVLAKLAWWMGIADPFWQYRIVLAAITLMSCAVAFVSFRKVTESLVEGPRRATLFATLLGLFTFHAFVPASVSRPMFESLALPWLLFCGAHSVAYDVFKIRRDLLLAVGGACLAFAFRPQVGICALVPIGIALAHRRVGDAVIASALGLVVFVALGFTDIFYHGSYHASLIRVLTHNVEHGASYGAQPWYYFLPLIFVFCFTPFLIARYPQNVWDQIRSLRALIAMMVLFVFLHSLFANKFERFLVPAFGPLLILMAPFVQHLFINFSAYRARLILLLALNLPLWFMASFFPAQKTIIDMSLYFRDHPEIAHVTAINESIEWLPAALVAGQVPEVKQLDSADLTSPPQGYYSVREGEMPRLRDAFVDCLPLRSFHSTPLDQLAFKLNPGKNLRRSPILLLQCPGAEGAAL